MKVALLKNILVSAITDIDDSSVQMVFKSESATDFSLIGVVLTHAIHFWNSTATGAVHPVASYIHEAINRGSLACSIEVYDITAHLDGSAHGSPVAMQPFSLGAAFTTDNNEPSGCAACLSFQSDYGTDVEFGPGTRPRARDRNRMYLGPLNRHAISPGSATADATLSSEFMADALDALFDLSESVSTGSDEWVLQQWSRTNAAVKLPTVGWMDPRVDYQRRRSDPQPKGKVFKTLASV